MNQQMRYLDFPVEEMELRIRRAKELLAEEDMAGMVVTAAANHFYFTGVRKLANWATFTRTVFVFIPRDKEPVLYVQNFGGPEALSRSAVQDVRTFDEIMGAPVDVSACQGNRPLLSSLPPLTQPVRSARGSRASSTRLMDSARLSRIP